MASGKCALRSQFRGNGGRYGHLRHSSSTIAMPLTGRALPPPPSCALCNAADRAPNSPPQLSPYRAALVRHAAHYALLSLQCPNRAPVFAGVRPLLPPPSLQCPDRAPPPWPPLQCPDPLAPACCRVRPLHPSSPLAMPYDRGPRVAGVRPLHPLPPLQCPNRCPPCPRCLQGTATPPPPPFGNALTVPPVLQGYPLPPSPSCNALTVPPSPPFLPLQCPDRAPCCRYGHSTPSTSRANLSPSSYSHGGDSSVPLVLFHSSAERLNKSLVHRASRQQRSPPGDLHNYRFHYTHLTFLRKHRKLRVYGVCGSGHAGAPPAYTRPLVSAVRPLPPLLLCNALTVPHHHLPHCAMPNRAHSTPSLCQCPKPCPTPPLPFAMTPNRAPMLQRYGPLTPLPPFAMPPDRAPSRPSPLCNGPYRAPSSPPPLPFAMPLTVPHSTPPPLCRCPVTVPHSTLPFAMPPNRCPLPTPTLANAPNRAPSPSHPCMP
ncbi:hypothetical protein C7M84_007502 [Penaeus vannamei]|uniref:Uncharacterized protein n=1 Tax=Penaeus vannamei TaxID=6689 RepID=A0A423TC87_PENVA|nr:hypothetical protein C7M84_007502 [Penaeus vannamei]